MNKRNHPDWMGENRKMTAEEIADFLSGPIVARIATIDETGIPYITPVWQEWDITRHGVYDFDHTGWASSTGSRAVL